MRRSFTSDTSKFRSSRLNRSLTKDITKKEINDELRFSDKQLVNGSKDSEKVHQLKQKIRYIVDDEPKQEEISKQFMKMEKVEEDNKEEEGEEKFERSKNEDEPIKI